MPAARVSLLALLVLAAACNGSVKGDPDGGAQSTDGGNPDAGTDAGNQRPTVFPSISSFTATCDSNSAGNVAYLGGCAFTGQGCMSCVVVGLPVDGGEPMALHSDVSSCDTAGACAPLSVSGDVPLANFQILALETGLCEPDGGALEPGSSVVSDESDVDLTALSCN